MRKTIGNSKWLVFLFLPFVLSACFEPEEGCVDINATNFKVDADRPCSDCCEYPVISVDFQHKVVLPDTVFNLEYDKPLCCDGAGNAFYIRNIRYYFSEIRLIRPDGERVGVTDTLIVPVAGSGSGTELVTIEDNFALINPGVFGRKKMGTFRASGNFNRVAFSQGVPGDANLVAPTEFPDGHPLSDTSMYRNLDDGRLFYHLELYLITAPSDTTEMVIDIFGPENLQVVELPLEPSSLFYLDPGFNPTLQLRVDYLTWFKDVDLARDPGEVIIQKIVKNATDSFSVIEVTAN